MSMNWNRKDLLGLRELSPEEINFILETADAFKQVGTREIKKVPALRGKTMVNFFVEPSTRTRTSFELAAHRLSADVINISVTTAGRTKHACPPRVRKTRRHRFVQDRRRAPNCRRGKSFAHPARASAQRIFSRDRRIHHALRPDERTRETIEARLPRHASGTNQSRCRDR